MCYDEGTIKEILIKEELKTRFHIKKNILELILAAKQNDLEKVGDMIKTGVSVNCFNWKGTTPLHSSARAGHVAATSYLLKFGANVNQRDKSGKSPLHYAADGDFVEVAKLLLSNGAATNIVDNIRRTPLHFAIQNSSSKLVQILLGSKFDLNQQARECIPVLHLLFKKFFY